MKPELATNPNWIGFNCYKRAWTEFSFWFCSTLFVLIHLLQKLTDSFYLASKSNFSTFNLRIRLCIFDIATVVVWRMLCDCALCNFPFLEKWVYYSRPFYVFFFKLLNVD